MNFVLFKCLPSFAGYLPSLPPHQQNVSFLLQIPNDPVRTCGSNCVHFADDSKSAQSSKPTSDFNAFRFFRSLFSLLIDDRILQVLILSYWLIPIKKTSLLPHITRIRELSPKLSLNRPCLLANLINFNQVTYRDFQPQHIFTFSKMMLALWKLVVKLVLVSCSDCLVWFTLFAFDVIICTAVFFYLFRLSETICVWQDFPTGSYHG